MRPLRNIILLHGLATTIKKSVNATIARKDAEIRDLQIRLTNVEERCDDLEQYSRRNTVRIRGVAEAQNENTDCVVKELSKAVDTDIRQRCGALPSSWEKGRGPFHATRYHRAFHDSQHKVFCDAIRAEAERYARLHQRGSDKDASHDCLGSANT